MSKKCLSSTLLAFFFLLTLIGATCWAEDPTSLIVVRASNDTLWKATCVGTTCTAFTWFPGLFDSQPTVYWDEKIWRYVLWGRASNSTVWRSTFNKAGVFMDDWAQMPAQADSPVAAAGSALVLPRFAGNFGDSIDVASLPICGTFSNLSTVGLSIHRVGWVVATASGIYSPGTADRFVRVALADTSAGTSFDSWGPIIESTAANFGSYGAEKRWTLQKFYSVTPGLSKTVYLKACKEDGATGTLMWNDYTVNYYSAQTN